MVMAAVALLVGAAAVGTSGDKPFAGTWSRDDVQLTLRQDGVHVTGEILRADAKGTIDSNVMGGVAMGNFMFGQEGGVFMARPQDGGLQVTLNTQMLQLSRGKRKTTRPPVAAKVPSSAETPAADAAPPAQRQQVRDSRAGWEGLLPMGWTVRKGGNPIWVGSDTEPGVMMLLYNGEMDEKAARQFLSAPIAVGEADRLVPSGGIGNVRAKSGTAMAVTGTVQSQERKLKGKVVVVLRAPDALVVAAFGEPSTFKTISARVDAFVETVNFTTPPAGAKAHLLRGGICTIPGYRMTFDGRGNVERYIPGSVFSAAPTEHMVGVSAATNSQRLQGRYTFDGNTLSIQWKDGGGKTCQPKSWKNGTVWSLDCADNKDWFAGACD